MMVRTTVIVTQDQLDAIRKRVGSKDRRKLINNLLKAFVDGKIHLKDDVDLNALAKRLDQEQERINKMRKLYGIKY